MISSDDLDFQLQKRIYIIYVYWQIGYLLLNEYWFGSNDPKNPRSPGINPAKYYYR